MGDVAGSDSQRRSWAPRLDPPTRLLLIRHGATALTGERRYSGHGDVALSPQGQAQSAALAKRLADWPVAAVVASPLARAIGTAQIVADALPAPLQVERDLMEIDFGEWEGHTFAEVQVGWPAQLEAWLCSSAAAPPSGESLDSLTVRVRAAAQRLRAQYPEQTIAVVTHVGPIKALLSAALDGGPAFPFRLHLEAAGISVIDSWPDGGVSVRGVNDTVHLRDV